MKRSGTAATSALLLLLFMLPASLLAISVFDVIRLSQERYADEEIIRLIRTTDSRFFLSAEDTIRLRTEGVAEAVIREMLSRPAPKREGQPPASEDAKPSLSRGAATRASGGGATGPRPGPLFSASSLKRTDAGPDLAAVTVSGMEVLTLRDRDRSSSPIERARAAAATLNRLAARPAGRFAARVAGPDARVAFEASGGRATDVLKVEPADVAGYRAWGGRPVSAEALASLWASLLNDYWQAIVVGKR